MHTLYSIRTGLFAHVVARLETADPDLERAEDILDQDTQNEVLTEDEARARFPELVERFERGDDRAARVLAALERLHLDANTVDAEGQHLWSARAAIRDSDKEAEARGESLDDRERRLAAEFYSALQQHLEHLQTPDFEALRRALDEAVGGGALTMSEGLESIAGGLQRASYGNGLAPMVLEHNQDPGATSCVVPFFVQIDNGYLEPSGPGEAKAPPKLIGLQELAARKNNRNGFTVDARQAAQVAFGQAFTLGGVTITGSDGTVVADRYARFSPVAHPGAVAPLGWTLSKASFDDLFSQFDQEENQRSVEELGKWYGGLSCTIEG